MKKHPTLDVYATKDGLIFREAKVGSYGHTRGHLYVMPQFICKATGYPMVSICTNGKTVNWNVHQIVMETYKEKVPGKPYIDHINRDKLDSRLENLRYVSQSENNLNSGRSDEASKKWGFHPYEDRKRYKAAWAKDKYKADAEYRAKNAESCRKWREKNAGRAKLDAVSKEVA